MREWFARRRKSDPTLHARHNLRRAIRQLGITAEEYEAALASQDGICAICGGGPTYTHHRLVLDHDHTTGAFRGLLCGRCNVLLSHALDDPALLHKAAAYLELHRR